MAGPSEEGLKRQIDRIVRKPKQLKTGRPLVDTVRLIAAGEAQNLEEALKRTRITFPKLLDELKMEGRLNEAEQVVEQYAWFALLLMYAKVAKAMSEGERFPYQLVKLMMERFDRKYMPKTALLMETVSVPDFEKLSDDELARMVFEQMPRKFAVAGGIVASRN